MADLAKTEAKPGSFARQTVYHSDIIPEARRSSTNLEVNARVQAPSGPSANAEALAKLLGVANQIGQGITQQAQENLDEKRTTQGALDSAKGFKDEKSYNRFREYRDGWQLQGAKQAALSISTEVTDAVNARLNDDENPVHDLNEVHSLVESIYNKHLFDGQGKLVDWGSTKAKNVMVNSLNEILSTVLPHAQSVIKTQTDNRLLSTIADNKIAEYFRGAPLGTPVKLAPAAAPADPLAPLPEGATAPLKGVPANSPQAGVASVLAGGGLPSKVVAGFLGNFHLEGGYNGQVGDSGAARGIAQWHAPRQANFLRVIGKPVSQATPAEQAKFVVWEMNNPTQAGMTVQQRDAILNAPTARQAAHLIDQFYERSNGGSRQARGAAAERFAAGGLPASAPYVPSASDPQLDSLVPSAPATASNLPPIDFESWIKEVPSSVDKGSAKKFFLQSIFNAAQQRGVPSILSGLVDSRRKDGTPSFSPTEVATILEAKDQLENKARADAKRAQSDLWDKNHDEVLKSYIAGNTPSEGFLQQAAASGQLDPTFVFSLQKQAEAEVKQSEREATAEAKDAERQAAAETDADVASMAAERQSGVNVGDPAANLKLFNSGRLGTGKQAARNLRLLNTADRAGGTLNASTPEVAQWAARLTKYAPQKGGSGGGLIAGRLGGTGTDAATYAVMHATFLDEVKKGKPPGVAYGEVVTKYAPKSAEGVERARLLRIQELKRKALTNN